MDEFLENFQGGGGGGGLFRSKKFHCKIFAIRNNNSFFKISLKKSQRLFGNFTEIHPFLKRQASQTSVGSVSGSLHIAQEFLQKSYLQKFIQSIIKSIITRANSKLISEAESLDNKIKLFVSEFPIKSYNYSTLKVVLGPILKS